MEIKATHRYARISPLKARDVARELKGLPVSAALEVIQFTPKKAAYLIGKTLKSAIANAENNHDLAAEHLIVKSATVTEGPTFRRFNPRARGSAAPIRKRTAHINVILTDEVAIDTGGGELEPEEETAPVGKKKTAKSGKGRKEVEAAEVGEAAEPAGEAGEGSR